MDKKLIERIALEVAQEAEALDADGECQKREGVDITEYVLDFTHRFLARIDAERGKEAVAWALFSENGNIRIWTSAPEEVRRLAEDQGMTLSPLYAAPQPPAPCQRPDPEQIIALRHAAAAEAQALENVALRAEIERLTQKNAELREKLHDESAQHVQFMLHDHPKALAARDATIAQQAERIAELEKVAKAYEDQVAAHNKTLDEVARLSATIEKCEKALASAVEWGVPMRDAPKSSRPYWFDDSVTALAAIAAHKKGGAQ